MRKKDKTNQVRTTYQHAGNQLERSGQHRFPTDRAREPVERLFLDVGVGIVCRVVGGLDYCRDLVGKWDFVDLSIDLSDRVGGE